MVSKARTWIGAATIIAAVGIGFTALSANPAAVFAKGPKGDHSANPESMKKPGQSCDELTKGSDEYKECVKAQAQQYKHDKGKAKGKGRGKGKEDGDDATDE